MLICATPQVRLEDVNFYYSNPSAPSTTCEQFTSDTVMVLQQLFTSAGVSPLGPTSYSVGELNNNLRVFELEEGGSSNSVPQSTTGELTVMHRKT